ncbi:MAG: hypothetical protein V3V08_19995 [Nannocystaceae bacterium]
MPLADASASVDKYKWASSWRTIDNEGKDIFNAADPDDATKFLWNGIPNVFILQTSTMKLVKAEEMDGQLDVPSEVTTLNN